MAAITRRTLVTAGTLAAALGIGVTGVVIADDDATWDSDDTNDAHTDDDGYTFGEGAYGTASPVAETGYEMPRTSAS